MALAVDLEDAYSREQFKLLMELLVQYGISLTLTRWLTSSTPGRKGCHVTLKLDLHAPTTDNRTSTSPPPNPPAPPPPPPPPPVLSPVLYNVCTNGLADLNNNGLSRVLMLSYDGLIYTTASDINTAVTAVQEQLEEVSHWCQETESETNPSNAQALWCTLNNKAVGQTMPGVSFNGEFIERTNSLTCLGIHLDRMLTYKTRVETTKLRCKNCPR